MNTILKYSDNTPRQVADQANRIFGNLLPENCYFTVGKTPNGRSRLQIKCDGKVAYEFNAGVRNAIPQKADLTEDAINNALEYMKKYFFNESVRESLNEAQLGDKVALGKEQGYVIGQMSDGSWIVQIQYSTKVAKDKELKVIRGLAQKGAAKPPMKFDDKTQKLLFEQYIHCGVFFNSVPIKTTNCYVKYSDMLVDSPTVNVLVEGQLTVMPKEQIRLFENPNDFANPQDYVPGVTVDEVTEEATGNCLVHAGDYSQAVGDADSCRCIFGSENQEPRMETLPRSRVRTLSV